MKFTKLRGGKKRKPSSREDWLANLIYNLKCINIDKDQDN